MNTSKNISRLIESTLQSRAFQDFVTVTQDTAEWAVNGQPVMMSKVFRRRSTTAERILLQTTCCGLEHSKANDIVQSLLRAADMPLLGKFDWIDDTHPVEGQGGKQQEEKQMKKFLVVQRYFDNGHTESEVLHTEKDSEAITAAGYHDGQHEERETYDLWVEGFETLSEAQQCKQDTLNA